MRLLHETNEVSSGGRQPGEEEEFNLFLFSFLPIPLSFTSALFAAKNEIKPTVCVCVKGLGVINQTLSFLLLLFFLKTGVYSLFSVCLPLHQ